MPSASLVYSFPAPLGRRGAAAVVVAGLHVLLVTALVTGLVISRIVPPEPSRPPSVVAPSDPEPVHPPLKVDGPTLTWTRTALIVDPPLLPPVEPPRAIDDPEIAPLVPPVAAPPSVLRPARVTHSEEPLYPASARRLNEEGVVVVQVLVGVDGRPAAVDVATSSGSPRLDSAALASVRRWLFQPAANGAGPIASYAFVRVVFRLTN